MLFFSLILYVTAIVLFALSYAIYKGNNQLIHDYHQKNIKDIPAYCRAFSKALLILPFSFSIAATVALLSSNTCIIRISTGILIAGALYSILQIVRVQKKYNNGVF